MLQYLKYICILLAVLLVFGAARFLDGNDLFRPVQQVSDQPSETRLQTEESSAPADETETSADETQAEETQAEETQPEETQPPQTEPPQSAQEDFLLTFGGNCVLGGTASQSYNPNGIIQTVGEDYGYPFRHLAPYLQEDDFTFLTLSSPLTDTNAYSKTQQIYSAPASFVQILAQASVESVSLASEHIRDHGEDGYASTLSALEEAGIHYTQNNTATVFTTEGGLTIGIYAVESISDKVDTAKVAEEIAALDARADLVVFAPHWGVLRYYLPVASQTELAHAAIDAGADLVIGSHPLVLQPMEEYNGGLIFYSLGYLCAGNLNAPVDFDSTLVQLTVRRNADGTVALEEPSIIPLAFSSVPKKNNYQPIPYTQEDPGYGNVLSKLAGTHSLKSLP